MERSTERVSDRARKVFALANQEAQRWKHDHIGSEHVFLAILNERTGVAVHVLKHLNGDLQKAQAQIEQLIKDRDSDVVVFGKLPQTPQPKKS